MSFWMNLDSNEIQVNILGEQALVDKKKFVNQYQYSSFKLWIILFVNKKMYCAEKHTAMKGLIDNSFIK